MNNILRVQHKFVLLWLNVHACLYKKKEETFLNNTFNLLELQLEKLALRKNLSSKECASVLRSLAIMRKK